jgi:hypothetical protein
MVTLTHAAAAASPVVVHPPTTLTSGVAVWTETEVIPPPTTLMSGVIGPNGVNVLVESPATLISIVSSAARTLKTAKEAMMSKESDLNIFGISG